MGLNRRWPLLALLLALSSCQGSKPPPTGPGGIVNDFGATGDAGPSPAAAPGGGKTHDAADDSESADGGAGLANDAGPAAPNADAQAGDSARPPDAGEPAGCPERDGAPATGVSIAGEYYLAGTLIAQGELEKKLSPERHISLFEFEVRLFQDKPFGGGKVMLAGALDDRFRDAQRDVEFSAVPVAEDGSFTLELPGVSISPDGPFQLMKTEVLANLTITGVIRGEDCLNGKITVDIPTPDYRDEGLKGLKAQWKGSFYASLRQRLTLADKDRGMCDGCSVPDADAGAAD
ncbi:MAG: hypothetical protein GMKNLPBB_00935 [Myxococcota bacterium]|nr:hypothetical protein [Myxococcota bacterium]